MHRIIFSFLLLFPLFIGCNRPTKEASKTTPLVVVSLPPYVDFVKRIAGLTVEVKSAVPEGFDPHLYEATPAQMQSLVNASLWIGIGEPSEKKILQALKNQSPGLHTLNLSAHVPLLPGSEEFDICEHGEHHHADGRDLHIWMSPMLAKMQVELIANALIDQFPEHEKLYQKRLSKLLKKLTELDDSIKKTLEPVSGSAILVSHPSFGYFCYEYNLIQIAVECEGKAPLPQSTAKIIDLAKKHHVLCTLISPQFSNRGAILISKKLGLKTYNVNPLAENYFENLKNMATLIAKSGKQDG